MGAFSACWQQQTAAKFERASVNLLLRSRYSFLILRRCEEGNMSTIREQGDSKKRQSRDKFTCRRLRLFLLLSCDRTQRVSRSGSRAVPCSPRHFLNLWLSMSKAAFSYEFHISWISLRIATCFALPRCYSCSQLAPCRVKTLHGALLLVPVGVAPCRCSCVCKHPPSIAAPRRLIQLNSDLTYRTWEMNKEVCKIKSLELYIRRFPLVKLYYI